MVMKMPSRLHFPGKIRQVLFKSKALIESFYLSLTLTHTHADTHTHTRRHTHTHAHFFPLITKSEIKSNLVTCSSPFHQHFTSISLTKFPFAKEIQTHTPCVIVTTFI